MSEAKTVAVLTQDLMNAQVGVLGSMLIDEECVGFVLSRVSERDFVTQQYRSIFRAIRTLFREGLPTDAIAVREKLGGKLGDGWSKLLTGIMDYTPTAANVDGYVQMLKEKSALYQLQELGTALQNAADMNEARSILDKAMQLQVGRPGIHALTFAKGYEEFFDRHSGETAVEHLDWATSKLITNDDGLLWLGTLKDQNDRYLLTPNPAEPKQLQLCVGPHVLPVKTYDNDTVPTTGTKVPMVIGDLNEGVVYWDLRSFSVKLSDTASVGTLNAFEQDLILWRGSLRDDCTKWDEDAFINGYIDTAVVQAVG